LAARIIGTLIIDGCKTGLTFDELVEKMQASKSSISTNLNLLQKMDKIFYFTKVGDRKKYFKAAPLSERINNFLSFFLHCQIYFGKDTHGSLFAELTEHNFLLNF